MTDTGKASAQRSTERGQIWREDIREVPRFHIASELLGRNESRKLTVAETTLTFAARSSQFRRFSVVTGIVHRSDTYSVGDCGST